jgi:hypothetical protein
MEKSKSGFMLPIQAPLKEFNAKGTAPSEPPHSNIWLKNWREHIENSKIVGTEKKDKIKAVKQLNAL